MIPAFMILPIIRDASGRLTFPDFVWRDNEEERARFAKIIEEDDEDAAIEWYDNHPSAIIECLNCGEGYVASETRWFKNCPRCIPDRDARTIRTSADLRSFQRSCGADV